MRGETAGAWNGTERFETLRVGAIPLEGDGGGVGGGVGGGGGGGGGGLRCDIERTTRAAAHA